MIGTVAAPEKSRCQAASEEITCCVYLIISPVTLSSGPWQDSYG